MSFAFFRAASSLSCAWITLSILDTSTRMFPWNDGEHVPVKMYCATPVFCEKTSQLIQLLTKTAGPIFIGYPLFLYKLFVGYTV